MGNVFVGETASSGQRSVSKIPINYTAKMPQKYNAVFLFKCPLNVLSNLKAGLSSLFSLLWSYFRAPQTAADPGGASRTGFG